MGYQRERTTLMATDPARDDVPGVSGRPGAASPDAEATPTGAAAAGAIHDLRTALTVVLGGLEHMVVVDQEDADIDVAEGVSEQDGKRREKCLGRGARRRPHLQHGDRDDDREHSVGKRFEPLCAHSLAPSAREGRRNARPTPVRFTLFADSGDRRG